jgi:hypothetical protein
MLGKCEFFCLSVKNVKKMEINQTFLAQPKPVNPTSFLHILSNVTGKK